MFFSLQLERKNVLKFHFRLDFTAMQDGTPFGNFLGRLPTSQTLDFLKISFGLVLIPV